MELKFFSLIFLFPVLVFASDVAQNTNPMPKASPGKPGDPMPPPKDMTAAPPAAQTPVVKKVNEDFSAFELISIKPFFKNKLRVGHLSAQLINANTNENLGTISGDLGDCKNCIRGASVKGKIGVKIYGQNMQSLKISRKSSSSVKLIACPATAPINSPDHSYTCEFGHADEAPMKLVLKVEP